MDISDTESHQTIRSFSTDYMPTWFLLEILLHLPVKSIFRFKSVSKHWRSLINDPSFVHLYITRSLQKNRKPPSSTWTLLFCYMNSYSGKIPPDYLGLDAAFKLCNSKYPGMVLPSRFQFLNQESLSSIRLLACDNGLLLCCINHIWQEFYFVCNPLTLHWVSVPRRRQLHKWVSVGFSVEPRDGSFQIARLAEFTGSSNVLDLEIYSSRESKWTERKLTCSSPVCLFITHRQGVSYKGILHWREYNNRIIAFDPVSETDSCRLIEMPRNRDRDGRGILRVSKGGLSLYYLEIHTRGFDMWELEDYEIGAWRLLHSVSVKEVWSMDTRVVRMVRSGRYNLLPLALHPFDCEVVYLACGERLASCNLRTRMLEIMESERLPSDCIDSWTVVPFVLPLWPTPVQGC